MAETAKPSGYRPSAFVALPVSWVLVLLLLGWLIWFDYQQNLQYQQSLGRQAANTGAQTAAQYFQSLNNQLLQLAEQERDLLDPGLPAREREQRLDRLDSLLEFRVSDLQGYALLDGNGRVARQRPANYLDILGTDSAAARHPLRMDRRGNTYHFQLSLPWDSGVFGQGRLLLSLGCAFLCASLQTQTPDGHLLTLSDSTAPVADGALVAVVPGTQWRLIDRIDRAQLHQRLWRGTLLGLMLLLLFVAATLLLFWMVKRKTRVLVDDSERFRELFYHGGMAELLIQAQDGRICESNKAAVRLFGLSPTKLAETDLQTLLGMDDSSLRKRIEHTLKKGGKRFSAHYTSSDVNPRELEVHASTIHDADTKLLHVVLTDVTERMESLRALRENEQKLSAILEASADGLLMTDAGGLIQVFNPAAEMMFGYLEEEVLQRHLRTVLPTCFAGTENDDLDSWIPSGGSGEVGAVRETAGARKSGEPLAVRVSLSRIDLAGSRHFVALIQDLTEQRRNEAQLAYLERHDVLTGLINRREFERRLDALLSFAERPETEYVLVYMDVDQFKVINDTCGHGAGDELLKQLAILIKSQLRESETIARMGGDEFGALLSDCTVERGEQICNGLLQNIRNFLFTWRDRSFDVAISIGIAAFRPHVEEASQVLSQADVACHMAKRLGRDRLHVYHRGDAELIRHHGDMHLVSTISQALNEGRFHLYAQPIVPVTPGRNGHTHYEILVRMVDERNELVIPDHFIPAAERYILMPAIDRWVINQLFSLQAENLRRWKEQDDGRGFLFGINLSGTSLTDDGFLNYLKRQFNDYQVPYTSICFEITETAAVTNLERAKHLIAELSALGCSFALDDFGTGLSSYSYLKLLPVDYLKIDGSFVRNMTEDPVDYAMVDSINQIGHILGLKTIAEWAENLGTLTQLRALNVDYAQGFGVGDLISVADFRLSLS